MDLKELFTVLREQGVAEVTFKLTQIKPENPSYYRHKNRKQQVASVEVNTVNTPDITEEVDVVAHANQRTNDQVAKFRNKYPNYKPESTATEKAKIAKAATKTKHTKVDKAARIAAFKKEHPNYFTIAEMAKVCDVGEMLIRRFITSTTSVIKVGKTNYYKLDDVYDRRLMFERDIVEHDGSRQGNSKFIADKLLELLK